MVLRKELKKCAEYNEKMAKKLHEDFLDLFKKEKGSAIELAGHLIAVSAATNSFLLQKLGVLVKGVETRSLNQENREGSSFILKAAIETIVQNNENYIRDMKKLLNQLEVI